MKKIRRAGEVVYFVAVVALMVVYLAVGISWTFLKWLFSRRATHMLVIVAALALMAYSAAIVLAMEPATANDQVSVGELVRRLERLEALNLPERLAKLETLLWGIMVGIGTLLIEAGGRFINNRRGRQ